MIVVCINNKRKGEEKMKNAISYLGLIAKNKLRTFLTKESGEVNIVAIVVLIGVAVILAMIFKDAISNLIETLISSISGNATNTITPP